MLRFEHYRLNTRRFESNASITPQKNQSKAWLRAGPRTWASVLWHWGRKVRAVVDHRVQPAFVGPSSPSQHHILIVFPTLLEHQIIIIVLLDLVEGKDMEKLSPSSLTSPFRYSLSFKSDKRTLEGIAPQCYIRSYHVSSLLRNTLYNWVSLLISSISFEPPDSSKCRQA